MAWLIVSVAAGLLLYAAWSDFTRWKIPNSAILALIAIYAAMAVARLAGGEPALAAGGLAGDLAAGLVLFVLGFALWMFRLMGAGDAKLFFPIGLFVGWFQLAVFGAALAVLAILTAILLRFKVPLHLQVYTIPARIEQIRETGKVPYGVLMVASALVALYARYSA